MRLFIAMLLTGCVLRPVALAQDERLEQSKLPFVLDPRFCGPGIGEACRAQPTPC
jgi:hypothetical protein